MMYLGSANSTSCVNTYEQLARQFRDKMWATPLFTQERVSYEQAANAWQKKADDAKTNGCPKSAKKPSFQAATDVAMTSAAAAAQAAGTTGGLSTGVKVGLAVGAVAILGGIVYFARSKR